MDNYMKKIAIRRWLVDHDISPKINLRLDNKELTLIFFVKNLIEKLKEYVRSTCEKDLPEYLRNLQFPFYIGNQYLLLLYQI